MIRSRTWCVLLAAGLMVPSVARAHGDALAFDFKDPKGVNAIVFVLDSMLEPIVGLASGISGTLNFNPHHPEQMTGKLVVDAASLHTEHEGMKKTLHGPDWMDVAQYPTIEFVIQSVSDVSRKGEGAYEMKVTGAFTCRGVTKTVTAPVRLNHLRDKLGSRLRGADGDLLVLRTQFTIDRLEFGIKPSAGTDVVAKDIELRVSIVGGSPKEGK